MKAGRLLSVSLFALATFGCSKSDSGAEVRARRLAYARDLYEKEEVLGSWEITPQNPDVLLGPEWGPPEIIGDPKHPYRIRRHMGRWATIRLRVDSDAPRTLTLTGVAAHAFPLRIVTIRAGNDVLDVFPPYSPTDTFEHSFRFSSEVIRKYREGDFIHLTFEVPTSEDPGARGWRAIGIAFKGIHWSTTPASSASSAESPRQNERAP